jgi:protein gp37
MNSTTIEWTHRPETGGAAGGFTWNPIRFRGPDGKTGTMCSHCSPGCLHCYAEAINKRFGTGQAYNLPELQRGEFYIDERILAEPLRRKKPATIFVGDMFDLFHEAIAEQLIEQVFLTIVEAKQHIFQILTKRAERMQNWVSCRMFRPHSHIWLGVSVEDQQRADERIPLLLQTPAAVRFLSVEPMLEAINLSKLIAMPERDGPNDNYWSCSLCGCNFDPGDAHECPLGFDTQKLDWIICGGESGPGARPFNLAWGESLLAQCKAAGVPFLMKQVGSKPVCDGKGYTCCVFPMKNR